MYIFITICIVFIAVLLIFVVIIQNPKGGRLVSGGSFANQMMGVRKSVDFFEKITWWLAGLLVVLCIFASILFIPCKKNILDISFFKGYSIKYNLNQDENCTL